VLGQIDDAGNVCITCGNTIENNRLDGVTVARAGSARLYGNTIQGNGATTNRWGVLAAEESFVWMEGGNRVINNGSPAGGGGVFARASSVRTGPGDQPINPSSNEISGNFVGILAVTGNLQLQGGLLVTRNTTHGITVDQGSRLRTDGSTITANGANGIFALGASGVGFVGAAVTNVTGNGSFGVFCADVNSHYFGNTVGVTGNTVGQVSCTPF
jgi:parallel beta-helix repeat protein